MTKKTVLTLADIEGGLVGRPTREPLSLSNLERSLPTGPPGLDETETRPPTVREPQTDALPRDSGDAYQKLMNSHEQELVARIHLRQLTTAQPEHEDFYYETYAGRQKGVSVEEGGILYLPMPPSMLTFKSLARDKKTATDLATALGKMSKGSARRPRTMLQVITSPVRSLVSGSGSELEALATIERVYTALAKAETGGDAGQAVMDIQETILSSDDAFLQFINRPKGQKATSRVVRAIGHEKAIAFAERLLRVFEYMSVLKEEGSAESFVSSVMGPLVGLANYFEAAQVRHFLELILAKSTLAWIAIHRVGQVLLCILCSRLAILNAVSSQPDSPIGDMADLHERLLLALQNNLSDMATNRYGWQLLALLAAQVDADQKRTIVLQVRERILAAVESDDTGPVNILLHALGLDAAQLKPSSQ